jgi:hypothetical protein
LFFLFAISTNADLEIFAVALYGKIDEELQAPGSPGRPCSPWRCRMRRHRPR